MDRAADPAQQTRDVLVDTLGLSLHAIVHPADVQDRDGSGLVLATLFGRWPFLARLFADGGNAGPVFQTPIVDKPRG